MTYIGSRLRYLRKQDNITQQQLADSIGVAKSTISMYESGQREPDFETLEALADYFNVEMSTFFPGGSTIPGLLPLPAGEAAPDPKEARLTDLYRQLNTDGQEKLIDYADDLVSSGKYIKSDPSKLGQKQA